MRTVVAVILDVATHIFALRLDVDTDTDCTRRPIIVSADPIYMGNHD